MCSLLAAQPDRLVEQCLYAQTEVALHGHHLTADTIIRIIDRIVKVKMALGA